MSSRDVNTEEKNKEDKKEEWKMKPETEQTKYISIKEDLENVTVPKKKGVGKKKLGSTVDKDTRTKSELSYEGMGKEGAESDESNEDEECAESREDCSEKNQRMCTSDGSGSGEAGEAEERRSRRTAAINQRLLMKKIASQEPVVEVSEDSPDVKRRKRTERRKINLLTDNEEYGDGMYEPSGIYEEDTPYEPRVKYEHSRRYEGEDNVQEYMSDEHVTQEVLDNPGEIYNFNEHEVKRKIKKVLVNKENIFKKGLKHVEEYMINNMSMMMGNNNEQLRRMGLENIKVETEFFYKLGGSYEDMGDQVEEVNRKIEALQGELSELHMKMGKSQLTKQNEPSMLYAYVSQTLNIKDKTLEYEDILQEMKDFQDLVNDEHREKRRLFKNLIMGTSKQMLKVEQEYQKNDAERMKQVLQLYKNVSSMMDLFWKKIEKFAWEHLKKDLQQELIKKKKQNLDKFIQDAIKVSINDQERYIFDKKIKGTGGESSRIKMESSEEEAAADESGKEAKDRGAGEERKVNGVGRMSRRKGTTAQSGQSSSSTKVGIDKNVAATSSSKTKTNEDEEELVEDEYVFDKDEEKMELDDLKLEDEMDSDKEENELDDLQKDLEMPLEELLKMYKQQSNGDFDDEYEEEFSDYTEDQTPDDNDDEMHKDNQESPVEPAEQDAVVEPDQEHESPVEVDQDHVVACSKSQTRPGHTNSKTADAKSTEKEVKAAVKDTRSPGETTTTRQSDQSSSSTKVGIDKNVAATSSSKTKTNEDEEELVEDEYVFDKDEEKMELDDLKLEDEMDSDKEENELDDLQKDLEMPLEELLKMYKQQSNGDFDDEYEEEFSDYTEDQTPDDNDDEMQKGDEDSVTRQEDDNGLSEVSEDDLSDMSLETSENEEGRKDALSGGRGKRSAVSKDSKSHSASRRVAKTVEITTKYSNEEEQPDATSVREIPLPQKRPREPESKSPSGRGTRTSPTRRQTDSLSHSRSTRPSPSSRDSTAAAAKRDGRNSKDTTAYTLSKDRTDSSSLTKTAQPSSLSKDSTASKENTDSKDGTEGGEVKVPFLIKAVLRQYQKEGLGWLVSLYERGINGILADEMGLGKTLQTISLLAYLACYKENWGPHIIIVPTSILLNWVMEFNRFCPGFKVLAYYGTPAERARRRSGWNRPHSFNVLVSSYSIVVQDAYVLKRRAWEYMILDEAQNIKNFNSKRWQTLLTFNTKYRLLLTGTPLQNSLQELWSLMHFILPNVFTSHTQFNIWFTDPLNQALDNLYSSNPLYKNENDLENKEKEEMNRNNMELVEKLHVIFRPYLLRRLKKDVEKQMPSKYEHVLKCTLTKRQQVLYDEFISLYNLNSKGLDKERLSYRSMLNILMQLRKICNHPDQLKSRDVQIPIEFNIEPLTLPSMFKVIETGSIYNRRNGDEESLVSETNGTYGNGMYGNGRNGSGMYGNGRNGSGMYGNGRNGSGMYGNGRNGSGMYGNGSGMYGNGVESSHLYNDHGQGVEYTGAEMSGSSRTKYHRSKNDTERVKTEVSPTSATGIHTRSSPSPVPGATRHSMRISRFESPQEGNTSYRIKEETSPEQKSRSSGSDSVTRVLNTPSSKRGSRSGDSSSGSGGAEGTGVFCSSSSNSNSNSMASMASPMNSSQDSITCSGDEVREGSPTAAQDTSQTDRDYTSAGVDNGTTEPLAFTSDTLKGRGKVNGLCMESYKRRRDRLIVDKRVTRRRLDLNLNSECLIQYTAVSDAGVLDFGADLTNCGYGFRHGKVHTNDLLIAHPTMVKLTSTLLRNYNASNNNGNNSITNLNNNITNGYNKTNGMGYAAQAGNSWGVDTRARGNGCSKTNLTNPNAEEALESVFNFNLKNDLEMNKMIEAYAPLVENFLVLPTKVVSRPIKLYYSGETGVNHNIRNDWLIREVTTKVFERDDKEYYAKNKVTLEAINSQYRLLFPSKRALNDDCGKFRVLGPLLLRLKSEGHRCIIYTQFSKMLDILENWINFMGFTYTRLDGSTKIDMRQKIVNRFNENTKIFLFISSTRSGGVGITLTGADTVIFYDTDWNPAIDRQAMDRCHRIGQTKDVNVYRLISEHTVEENIWRKQLQKRKLDDLIVDQGQFDIQHNAWFSNIDTLINIFQSKKDDDEEDNIYGKTILHESNVGETNLKGTGVKSLKMLIEVEDADDSMALKKLTKENEKINKEDFENDMINTIPGLVTYCIKFLLKYQTAALERQVELMKVKIQVEDYQNKQDDEEGDEDDIYTDYDSEDEVGEGSNEEEEEEDQEEEDDDDDE